jgi:oligopeptide/dipeptide ABC transporter ATP-binding protein
MAELGVGVMAPQENAVPDIEVPAAPLAELRGVTKAFRGSGLGLMSPKVVNRAVDNVDVTINRGEFIALVGESGSGKSTLGRIMLGLLDADDGAVLYRDRDMANFTRAERTTFRRDVQAVFQDSGASLNPRRTILQSVEVPLLYNCGLPRNTARTRAAELLDRVGLPPALFQDRLPHELSGGQRQRVGLARAMASDPTLIVADEPVSALDVSVRAKVLSLMRDLQREASVAYLFITHDLGVVRSLADRVLVMYRGAIVEEGPATTVIKRPLHPYTQALVAATPVADPRARKRSEPSMIRETASSPDPSIGCRFRGRCPAAIDVCHSPPEYRRIGDDVAVACHRV